MAGFLYRLGVSLKEFGQRRRCLPLIQFGMWLREKALGANIGAPFEEFWQQLGGNKRNV